MRARRRHSKGAVALEAAIIVPTLFFVIMTILVSGMGVFRYQQMAYLAREGARYASVHGGQYAAETGNSAASATDVYNNAIKPKAIALSLDHLSYSVSWNSSNYPYHVNIVNNQLVKVTNTVTVTVSYNWVPEFYFGGMTLSSTSVMPMAY
jgi:Flp pilus assembly protein TadG